MSITKEFKDFLIKGNVMDLAIAVVIGAAFSAIVSSLVDDVITPLLLTPALKAAHVENLDKLMWGAVKYGNFLSAILKFLVIGLVLFGVVKTMNTMMTKKVVVIKDSSSTDKLLMEIRDALKNKSGL